MAMELKYLLPILAIIGFSILESYSIAAQSTSTTPWPELGARRHGQNQPTTSSPRRDFVSQPSAWNKPLTSNNSPTNPSNTQSLQQSNKNNPQRSSTPPRDYVNPNIQLSYPTNPSGSTGSANNPINRNTQNPTRSPVNSRPASPTRDYVNPNIPLSYSNVANKNSNLNSNINAPNQNSLNPVNPTASTRPASPPRDYVNPNIAKPSYSNVLKPNNNEGKPQSTGSSTKPGSSTTPPSRITGSNSNQPQSTTPNPKIRLDENNELQEFSENLIRKDSNNGFKYVKVNYQGMTRSNSLKDEAPENLMTIDAAAYKIPTVEKLVALHNNYIVKSDQNEVYTAQERIEENNFLDTILSTPVMQYTRNFLIQRGKISKDPKDFKDILRTIWFNMYSRGGGKIGSSGFEHVYLAEIKKDAVSGLHNWLYFNDEEKKKTANYLGYMKKLEFDKGAILKFHFNFQDIDKPVGSMFIGTSPEFELALYSTCFLVRPDDVCPLRLGGKNFVIRTYTYKYRGKTMIGSAFPEI